MNLVRPFVGKRIFDGDDVAFLIDPFEHDLGCRRCIGYLGFRHHLY